jgi:spore germination protein YaaH
VRQRGHAGPDGDGAGRRKWLGPIALVAIVALIGVFAIGLDRDAPTTAVTASGAASSAPELGRAPTATPAEPADPTPVPIPKHEVYGYVPYWEMDDSIASHVGRTDLTTLGLFSVTHRRTGELATNQNGYRRITGPIGRAMIREAREQDTRVEIVYTSFGETKNRRFYERPEAQERWIEELVDLTERLGLDGINVDVELLPLDLVPAYGDFVGRLREALVERLPDAQLSVATQANEDGASMAAAAAAAGADRIFMMAYDYHWAGSNPGASAPIDRYDGRPKDLVWSLDLYHAFGVPVDRTLLGLPLYGMTWPVIGPDVGALETGRGEPWVPRRNLRVLDDPDFEPIYEPIESVEFYAVEGDDDEWDAVYYDSPRSLTPKLALADERGLAGAGFWAIGYERGLRDYTRLISTFAAGELELEAATEP